MGFAGLAVLLLSLLWLPAAAAQSFETNVSNKGTVAAAFLEIGVGARAEAMGGAYAAEAGRLEMVYWNPAGLAYLDGLGASFTHAEWLAETSFDFAAVAAPLPFFNSVVGFGFTTLGVPDQAVRTPEAPDGTGELYNARDFAAALSFSARLIPAFSFGVTTKLVSQRIWTETARQVAFDVGVYYRTPLPGLAMGASILNFGPDLALSGKNLTGIVDPDPFNTGIENIPFEYRTDGHPMPQTFRFGLCYARPLPAARSSFTTTVNLLHPTGSTESMSLGFEYGFADVLFLRGGYQNLFERNWWRGADEGVLGRRQVNGLTLGAGIQYRLRDRSRFVFDYAWADWTLLDKVHHLSFSVYLQ